ncbi:hypothetical protein [Mycobacterium hubeiense]|uniref:hypothetical protein n=1 Tax=Mycobacterium hubeiense TaxID=1867256 RepID=UPI000C7F6FE1|nr:hypothetical protein [Mycobacterium sp. QGD 101]
MAALRDLLEVYGALDEAAAADPAVATALDDFLPDASANTGWYREIEEFFFRENARTSPNLQAACRRIGEQAQAGAPLTNPQKSRLLYGLSAAARIKQITGTQALPSFDDDDFQDALDGVVAAIGPDDDPAHWDSSLAKAQGCKADFVAAAQSEFGGWKHFETLRSATADIGMVDPVLQRIPLCRAVVRTINGIQSVVIDTAMSSDDITLTNLKKVVNPFNWARNYSDFFQRMTPCPEPHRPDGWRQVLESVGFDKFEGSWITTALKYYPSEGKGEARIDYDLDDPTPGPGDGQVLVDRGFINMWATNADRDPDQPGVRVRTRKVVHIKGLSPFAQQRLVCITGYGTASNEFLFGPAAHPPDETREFAYYEAGVAPQAGLTDEDGPATHVAATAVGLWTEAVRDLTNDYFDLAEKWMAGGLTLTDITDFSQQFTGHLINAPLNFLERVNRPRNRHTSDARRDGGQ